MVLANTCPHDRIAPSIIYVSSMRQVGLTQVPFKLLLLPWILESVDLCEPFKNEVSISHSSLTLPKVSPPGFQIQMFWRLIFLV